MKYIVIDRKGGDIFCDEYDSLIEAIEAARNEWNRLSDYDKKHRDEFIVLESANPDEDAEDHFDGDPVFDCMKEDDMTTFAVILRKIGCTMKHLSNKYSIPYRTVQDWKSGEGNCPKYILNMLCEIYRL